MNIKDLNFGKIIIPLILFLLFIGTVFGIVNYNKSRQIEKTPVGEEVKEPSIIENLEPSSSLETNDTRYEISGKLKGRRNKVTINGEKVKLQRGNTFKKAIDLSEGDNEITIEAENTKGEKETKKISIKRLVVKENQTENGEVLGNETQGGKESVPQTGVENGTLTETGPKENAAFAITSLSIVFYFWKKSRKNLNSLTR